MNNLKLDFSPKRRPQIHLLSSWSLKKIDARSFLETKIDPTLFSIISRFSSVSEGVYHISSLLLDLKKSKQTPLQVLQEMFKNFRPFKFSIENKEAALLIHNKKYLRCTHPMHLMTKKKVIKAIETEAQLTGKWVLAISEQTSLKNKFAKDTNNPRLFLLHKIQSYLLHLYRNEKDTMSGAKREELDRYIQLTILAISEGLGFGG